MASLEVQDRVHLLAILTIPSGQSSSLAHTPAATPKRPEAKYVRGDVMAPYDSLLIATTEDAFTGTITVGVLADAAEDPEVAANYVTLQSPPGTDVAIAADKGIVLTATPFPALAIFSTLAEGDVATFFIYGIQDDR